MGAYFQGGLTFQVMFTNWGLYSQGTVQLIDLDKKRNVKRTSERSLLPIVKSILGNCSNYGRNFSFSEAIYQPNSRSRGGLFSGVKDLQGPWGLIFKGGLLSRGGLLFRVYSIGNTSLCVALTEQANSHSSGASYHGEQGYN